jgi:hypothetical protein
MTQAKKLGIGKFIMQGNLVCKPPEYIEQAIFAPVFLSSQSDLIGFRKVKR